MADIIRQVFVQALRGEHAHVHPMAVFEGLTAVQARKRPRRGLATVWEQLAHMVFWQDIFLMRMRGEAPPPVPHDADGWPKMPTVKGQEENWRALVARFEQGLREAGGRARRVELKAKMSRAVKRTFADQLMSMSLHNSYHAGQIVTLRRMMGLWPPPSGGDTW